MLEIFFGEFIQNQLNSLFMLARKTKKATQKYSMYVLIRYFLLNELKISHSKEFPNFVCVYPQEV